MIRISEGVDIELYQPSQRRERLQPVIKVPLQPIMFEVPIGSVRQSSKSPPMLENIFCSTSASKAKQIKMMTMAQNRPGYSPSLVDPAQLNLTTEQLFQVFKTKTSPQAVVRSTRDDAANSPLQVVSSPTFCKRSSFKLRARLRDNSYTIKRQFQVQINQKVVESETGMQSSKASESQKEHSLPLGAQDQPNGQPTAKKSVAASGSVTGPWETSPPSNKLAERCGELLGEEAKQQQQTSASWISSGLDRMEVDKNCDLVIVTQETLIEREEDEVQIQEINLKDEEGGSVVIGKPGPITPQDSIMQLKEADAEPRDQAMTLIDTAPIPEQNQESKPAKTIVTLPHQSQQNGVSIYDQIVTEAKLNFRRVPARRLRCNTKNADKSEVSMRQQVLVIEPTVTTIHGSQTLSGIVNWAPFSPPIAPEDASRQTMTLEDGIMTTEGSKNAPNSRQSRRRASLYKTQKFAPRSSQINANDVYLQISPRIFNNQIFHADGAKSWGRMGFKPAPDVSCRSKREAMRKMAGLCSMKQASVTSDTQTRTGSGQDQLLLNAKIQPVTPEPYLYEDELPQHRSPSPKQKKAIQINQQLVDDDLGEIKRFSQTMQPNSLGPAMAALAVCGEETTLKSSTVAMNDTVVHFMQQTDGDLNNSITGSITVDQQAFDQSMMSEVGKKSQTENENERLELASKSSQANMPYDYQVASSHQLGDINSIGQRAAKRRRAKVAAKNARVQIDERVSQSVQQSSNLDAESSTHQSRLTPRELLQNLNQPGGSGGWSIEKARKAATKYQKSVRENGNQKLSPTSQLAVSIQRTHRNNMSQSTGSAERRSQEGKSAQVIEDQRELERRKKVFLRQVYTNMQRTGQRKLKYDHISCNLKVDISNNYMRRKQATLDKNEWHFRRMQNKLKDGTARDGNHLTEHRLTEDSISGTNHTMSYHDPAAVTTGEYTNRQESSLSNKMHTMSRSRQNLRLEDQSLYPNTPLLSISPKGGTMVHQSPRQSLKVRCSPTKNILSPTQKRSDISAAIQHIQIELKMTQSDEKRQIYKKAQKSTLKSLKDDQFQKSQGSSQISFNPCVKKQSKAEHELRPRKRDWQEQYFPNVHGLISPPDQVDSISPVRNQIGETAYLNHIQARLKIKSQGHVARPRPRHLIKQSLQAGGTIAIGTLATTNQSSIAQVSLTSRSQVRTGESAQRPKLLMVLKEDQALVGVVDCSGGGSNQELRPDELCALKPKGMRTTTHSLLPSEIGGNNRSYAQQQIMTPRSRFTTDNVQTLQLHQSQQSVQQHHNHPTAPPSPLAINNALSTKLAQPKQSRNFQNQTMEYPAHHSKSKTMSNFTVNRATPSLFRPFQVNTIEIDSIVKASTAAQAFATKRDLQKVEQRMGQHRNEDTAAVAAQLQLSQQLVRQKPATGGLQRRQAMHRTLSHDQQGSQNQQLPQPAVLVRRNFRQAIDMNRVVSERNKELRRKAFSFSKKVERTDICQMAKNLDDLSKQTLARIKISDESAGTKPKKLYEDL